MFGVKFYGRLFSLITILSALICFPTLVFSQAYEGYWVPKDIPKSHYKIETKINVTNAEVEGKGKIVLNNTASRPIQIIAFDWSISDRSSLTVSIGGIQLTSLNAENDSLASSPLFYRLPHPVESGTSMELDVAYIISGSFDETEDTIWLSESEWYPRLWWDGLPSHDSFEVKIEAPEEYVVAASGRLNQETGYYENSGVKSFGIYLGKDRLTESKDVNGVLVTAVFTESSGEWAKVCMETAEKVVSFHRDWTGFYPFDFLYVLPGLPYPTGGYPFASGMVVIHGVESFSKVPLSYWKGIVTHEIGHQYWGEYVMDADESKWLWIGMGKYMDRKFSVANNIPPPKPGYLAGISRFFDTTMDLTEDEIEKINYDFNNIVKHAKSYSVIMALESVLGTETFDRVLLKCLREFGGRRCSFRDLWTIAEEESGENLAWFFDQWVRSNRYPYYKIESQECLLEGEKFISKVRIRRAGTLGMPMKVKVIFDDLSSQVGWTHRGLEITSLTFESKTKLLKVIVDPDNRVAMLTGPPPQLPEKVMELIALGPPKDSARSLELFKNLSYFEPISDFNFLFRLGITLFDGAYYPEAFLSFKKISDRDMYGIWRFRALVWMGAIKDILGEREEALKIYEEAIKGDTGDDIAYNNYGIRISRGWAEERLKTPFTVENK
jgi:tetratricopeptide (TPR) repeat protein